MPVQNCLEDHADALAHRHQYHGPAWVIDSKVTENECHLLDEFRQSLTLNSKRPTVDRRFFADGRSDDDNNNNIGNNNKNDNPNILLGLGTIITSCNSAGNNNKNNNNNNETITDINRQGVLHDDENKNKWVLDRDRPLASWLEHVLQTAIPHNKFHVLRYQRFLEYHQEGACLDPHTDGTKICDDTGWTSTHTLLLYLTDCEQGGDTILLWPKSSSSQKTKTKTKTNKNNKKSKKTNQLHKNGKQSPPEPEQQKQGHYEPEKTTAEGHPSAVKDSNDNDDDDNDDWKHNRKRWIYAAKPKRGRIFLFPHPMCHAGATIVDTPKICLRAEVCVSQEIHK